MAKTIAEKTVLITGAGGSIGSKLYRQIIKWKPKKLILLDVSEFAVYTLLEELKQHPAINGVDLIPLLGSVQDRQFLKKIFDHFAPETVYHAAAYKHVPLMEQNVMQCIANNVFGTLNMAHLSELVGQTTAQDIGLVAVAGILLLSVFLIKSGSLATMGLQSGASGFCGPQSTVLAVVVAVVLVLSQMQVIGTVGAVLASAFRNCRNRFKAEER